ncbi:MAG: phenylalanine--tRNA ligase subunit alpha [Bacteroidia bacterium]
MKIDLDAVEQDIRSFKPHSKEDVEAFRIRYSGKKGVLTDLFAGIKNIEPSERKLFGQKINTIKNLVEQKISEGIKLFPEEEKLIASEDDLTKPGEPMELGSRHPISIIRNEILEIFARIGFTVAEGPEIEDDWHNFTALNFPPDHPARDMQDTFFIEQNPDIALRTHTSSIQVRAMENSPPPIRVMCPGRVYRNEAISARSHCFFHQVEGLYIDEKVSFADLKQTLFYFAREMFGEDTKIRLRPSYFPFTEPSAEVDVTCILCNGAGCNVCKQTGWLEILGCGMVDPSVLENCNIDSMRYSGYAFGMGIERIAMLKYQVKDLRIFSENDVRFLKQFSGA